MANPKYADEAAAHTAKRPFPLPTGASDYCPNLARGAKVCNNHTRFKSCAYTHDKLPWMTAPYITWCTETPFKFTPKQRTTKVAKK